MSYDAFATTFSNSRKNLHWPELEYIIADIGSMNYDSVLDIGCGNGRFLEQAVVSGLQLREYIGIDSSEWMIREARKLHPENRFESIGMQNITTIDRSYGALLFLASFHHLETQIERINLLRDAKKLLIPGGRIYMTNWNLIDQLKYKTSHRWNGDYDIKIGQFSRYYHGFTVDELAELFEETGYRVIEHRIFDWKRNFLSILEQKNES